MKINDSGSLSENSGHKYSIDDPLKREELMHELLSERYQLELKRTQTIESKASNLVIISGILIGLMVNVVVSILSGNLISTSLISNSLILSGLLSLILSLFYSVSALYLSLLKNQPDITYHTLQFDMNSPVLHMLKRSSEEYDNVIVFNRMKNDHKSARLKKAFYFFVLGALLMAFFLLSIIGVLV
ncbi:hypothetical protein V7O66_07375 [Methanolobus sp. ZRKC3]|uniref:hypothetical protein n=1 Tax=Methanolobus sp. ZRKC3 TaxID=3125786 RepID=UPI003245AB32